MAWRRKYPKHNKQLYWPSELSWNISVEQETCSRFTYDYNCCLPTRILVHNHCTVPGWCSSYKMKYWNTRLKSIDKFSISVHFCKINLFNHNCNIQFLGVRFEKDFTPFAKPSHGIQRSEMNVLNVIMAYSTTICKLVDLISTLHQSDCQITN